MALLYQATLAKHTQVAAHSRRRQPDCVGQLSGALWALAQQLDGAAPLRVGQGRQGAVHGGPGRTPTQPVILRPLTRSASSRDTSPMACANVQTCPAQSL